VILGHSERRAYHRETDADVQEKVRAAQRAGLLAIVCIGETRAEREAGQALNMVGKQIAASLPVSVGTDGLVIAYEPVWAIGTGLTPTAADVAEVHGFIRRRLSERYGAGGQTVRILYGGSVKAANAAELLGAADVDGALVGGASLQAKDFLGIAATYR
jgi:triosephosphate isomerase